MFGLKQNTIDKTKNVFIQHPDIEQVVHYGSRAKGNYKVGSDIDLTFFGKNLDFSKLLKIDNELDDLLLPYKIDSSIYFKINCPKLKNHIDRVGISFYEKHSTETN